MGEFFNGGGLISYTGYWMARLTDGGVVSVRVHASESSASRVSLRFEVADTGIGIDAEAVPRLFESFAQG